MHPQLILNTSFCEWTKWYTNGGKLSVLIHMYAINIYNHPETKEQFFYFEN